MIKDARKVQELNAREVVRKRYHTWFGSNMPKTISAKELIDNGLDQIADNKATKCHIALTNNSITVWDNGVGISTENAKDGETFLYKAVAKLFTSTNYNDNEHTTGANGVGATATNHLSRHFQAVNLNSGKGYIFNTGLQVVGGEVQDEFKDYGVIDADQIPLTAQFSGNTGFAVSAEYDEEILPEEINIEWLQNYIALRGGELGPNAEIEVKVTVDGKTKTERFVKDKNKSGEYLKSWEERVLEIKGAEIRKIPRLGITYAFINTDNIQDEKIFCKIQPMVANAPVENTTSFNGVFTIGDRNAVLRIPYTFFIKSGKYPPYTDQTKVMITPAKAGIKEQVKAMSKETYAKYYSIAEKSLVKKIAEAEDKENYWSPMKGGKESKELIITEGYSAASGVKSMRNVKTQGVLALMGKILNCRHKSLMAGMKSPAVKKLYAIISEGTYDRVIICTDPDPDGASISGLLISFFDEYFPHLIDEGKVFWADVPIFVFSKGKEFAGSNNMDDCPRGWECQPKKGLGSYTQSEVKTFITNPETRTLWQIERGNNKEAQKLLDLAFVSCGKEWVIDKPEHVRNRHK